VNTVWFYEDWVVSRRTNERGEKKPLPVNWLFVTKAEREGGQEDGYVTVRAVRWPRKMK